MSWIDVMIGDLHLLHSVFSLTFGQFRDCRRPELDQLDQELWSSKLTAQLTSANDSRVLQTQQLDFRSQFHEASS
jgi:hypothetical protein